MTTSPLRLLVLPSLENHLDVGVTKISFLVVDLVEQPSCTYSEAGQRLVSEQQSSLESLAHSVSMYPLPGARASKSLVGPGADRSDQSGKPV